MSLTLTLNERNHLKTLSYILLALGLLSLPLDFPYHDEIAALLALLFVIGSALANYLTDPTSLTTDVQSIATATAQAITAEKTAVAAPQPTPKTVLEQLTSNLPATIAEAEAVFNQASANYKAVVAAATTPTPIESAPAS